MKFAYPLYSFVRVLVLGWVLWTGGTVPLQHFCRSGTFGVGFYFSVCSGSRGGGKWWKAHGGYHFNIFVEVVPSAWGEFYLFFFSVCSGSRGGGEMVDGAWRVPLPNNGWKTERSVGTTRRTIEPMENRTLGSIMRRRSSTK